MDDLLAGPQRLRALFAEAKPWAAASAVALRPVSGRRRVSTCFLVDDYFSDLLPPSQVIPNVLEAAAAAGLTLDYLARESACAWIPAGHGGVSPAELLVGRLVAEPVEGATGERPPAANSGWLSNGERSPSDTGLDAMDVPRDWQPPRQAAARRHSIFVDVQLWDGDGDKRVWSCALLAATWQLLRLGLIRDGGQPLAEPVEASPSWPQRWPDLPPVVRLNPKAAPFCAYTSVSILSSRFLPVELAVRTILGQVHHDPAVVDQIAVRAGQEGVSLPLEVLDRIGYVFAGTGEVDPA
jgi:hypothetical protein